MSEVYVLGCDVCKAKVDVSLVNGQGIEQWIDKIPNTTVDLAQYVLAFAGNYPDDELRCTVEATGCYHHSLLDACQIAGIPCRVYNQNQCARQED